MHDVNCRNCGANEYKNNKCTHCGSDFVPNKVQPLTTNLNGLEFHMLAEQGIQVGSHMFVSGMDWGYMESKGR